MRKNCWIPHIWNYGMPFHFSWTYRYGQAFCRRVDLHNRIAWGEFFKRGLWTWSGIFRNNIDTNSTRLKSVWVDYANHCLRKNTGTYFEPSSLEENWTFNDKDASPSMLPQKNFCAAKNNTCTFFVLSVKINLWAWQEVLDTLAKMGFETWF